jgi:hypothetical protein
MAVMMYVRDSNDHNTNHNQKMKIIAVINKNHKNTDMMIPLELN